jgi:hypothetical protein
MDNPEIQPDIRKDLDSAIKKLEHFNESQEPNPVNRRTNSARTLITLAFSEKARERERKKQAFAQRELLTAIQTIQKNYFYIQKLKKGSETEQALAESTIKVVQRYNQTIIKSGDNNSSLKTRISNFIYKHCGIEHCVELEKKMIHLPVDASVAINYKADSKAHEKINHTAIAFIQSETSAEHTLSHHEADAFRAKAISLLQNYGIRFTSVSEEFHSIRSTPIQAVINSKELIKMTQVIKPFPGETIAFRGEFQKDSKTSTKSIPLRESFEVLSNAHQTGFPHPTQHTGSSFVDCLIPACPARLDLLTDFSKLYMLKQQTASELLPKGKLNLQAKEILKLKKQAFNENKSLLIEQHITLNNSILQASLKDQDTKSSSTIIANFFKRVDEHETPFEYLGDTEETILYLFITKPFEKLKEVFVEHLNLNLYSTELKKRYLTALEILENTQQEAIQELNTNKRELIKNNDVTLDYIIYKGSLIGKACNLIMLQNLSDTIGFIPPILESFEKKIQAVVYSQATAFYLELNKNDINKNTVLDAMSNNLAQETHIFNAQFFEEIEIPVKKIVKELEIYYQNYFYLEN